jgi:hypothetical protein
MIEGVVVSLKNVEDDERKVDCEVGELSPGREIDRLRGECGECIGFGVTR